MSFRPVDFSQNPAQISHEKGRQANEEKSSFSAKTVFTLIECSSFSISERQFAHRLAPAYLYNTNIVGISDLASTRHWIAFISFWLSLDAHFFDLKIPMPILEELLNVLKDFEKMGSHLNSLQLEECEKGAREFLAEAKIGIEKRKLGYYGRFGYRAGVNNPGHALPLKMINRSNEVELLFLNLGEGLHMHPQVDWSGSSELFHFQSFPVLIPKKELFSEKGIRVFSRLIRLCLEECPQQTKEYSAEDVYGPVYGLGKISSTFQSKIADRASKSQYGDICGDMAIVLLIKDILIDLGVSKENIRRLFYLEQLFDILFFSSGLQKNNDNLDSWKLLINGIQEFSIRISKTYSSSFKDEELKLIYELLAEITEQAKKQIRKLEEKQLYTTEIEEKHDIQKAFLPQSGHSVETIQHPLYLTFIKPGKQESSLDPPLISLSVSPKEIRQTLDSWLLFVKKTAEEGNREYAYLFLYRAFLSLEVPSMEKGFWDEIDSADIEPVVSTLASLVTNGFYRKSERDLNYQAIFILSTGYAIVDYLVRRKYAPLFKGFASPFKPLSLKLVHYSFLKDWFSPTTLIPEGNFFNYEILPLKRLDSHWQKLKFYFEENLKKSSYVLFGLDKTIHDISEGVKELRNAGIYEEWSSTRQFLKFLEQFLDHAFPKGSKEIPLEEKFALIWANSEGIDLPKEIETLYFFAQTTNHAFVYHIREIESSKVLRSFKRSVTCTLTISSLKKEKEMSEFHQRQLGISMEMTRERFRKVTENQIFCLEKSNELPLSRYREWGRIYSNPDMQISSLLQWMRGNISLLNEAKYQRLIEFALFEPSVLSKRIEEEPKTLPQFRQLIFDAIQFYSGSPIELHTVVFLIRTGICLETYDKSPAGETIAYYEKILLDYLKKEEEKTLLYAHLLLLYQVGHPNKDHSLRELVKAQFWLNYHKGDGIPDWLLAETRVPFYSYFKAFELACQSPLWVENVCKEIFSLILPNLPMPSEKCWQAYPFLKWGDYAFHLEKGVLFCSGKRLIFLKERGNLQYSHFMQDGLFWEDARALITTDNLLKIEVAEENKSLVAARRFPSLKVFQTENAWFHRVKVSAGFLGHSLLSDSNLFDHWKCENQIVICRQLESKPLYYAREDEKNVLCIYKILPDGNLGPVLLPLEENISGNTDKNSLIQWFSRLGDSREVCIWLDQKTGHIQEIEFIELQISLVGEWLNGKWRFRLAQNKQLVLAEQQILSELNHFSGCLVFEKDGQRAVLIPGRTFEIKNKDFCTALSFSKDFILLFDRAFIYQIDSLSGELSHPSSLQNLYLCLFFAGLRDFQKAYFYLFRMPSFSYLKKDGAFLKLLGIFIGLKDDSPEALAFYLKFGIKLIENGLQILPEGYGKEPSVKELYRDSVKWLAKKLERYLRARSSSEISRVPGYIRLSLQEEAFLLQYLKPFLKNEDERATDVLLSGIPNFKLPSVEAFIKSSIPMPFWSESFSVREKMHVAKSCEVSIYPRMYVLLPPDLGSINVPSEASWFLNNPPLLVKPETKFEGMVRFDAKTIERYFMLLYERIKRGEGETDLFYLRRSILDVYVRAYSFVLNYVGKYPNEFKNLNFGEDLSQNRKVFEEIIRLATRATALLWESAHLVKKVFSEQAVFFRYQKTKTLSFPHPPAFEPIKWIFSNEQVKELSHLHTHIYHHFLDAYLDIDQTALFAPDTPFVFHSKTLKKESASQKELVENLNAGYLKLLEREQGQHVFHLKKKQSIEAIKEEAKKLYLSCREACLAVKKEAEEMANAYPVSAFRLGFQKIGKDIPEIKMEGILTSAYLQKDPMLLRRANPSLGPTSINKILFLAIKYHLLRIQLFRLEKGLLALNAQNLQLFGQAIFCVDNFNPCEEPEIFLYQSKSGKFFRPTQSKLFFWEIETSKPLPAKRLFSITTGEGKTSLYQPVVMKRLSRQGYFPISVSSKSLYLVDREGLKETSERVFSFEIHVCELALSKRTIPGDFKWIFEELQKRLACGGLKLIPETFYALHLKYQLALEEKDAETVKWISEIFNLFKTKGVALIDECRINCSPFTQAKIGIGKPIPLPEIDIRAVLEIYRILTDPKILTKKGQPLRDVVRLEENFQALLDKQERAEAAECAIAHLVHCKIFQIPEEEKKLIETFWLGGPEPLWLQNQKGSFHHRAIHLVKIYFSHFFKTAMKLVWRMKHVRSIKMGEEIHVPAKTKQASKAYFEEVYITLFATIQGTLQEGLSLQQAKRLLQELERKHYEQVGSRGEISDVDRLLQIWTGQKNMLLCRFSSSNYESCESFHSLFKKNSQAIFWYLEQVVLKQIAFCPEQLAVTPIYFLNAFRSVTLFSAEPGPQEIYGIYEKGEAVRKDPLFLAHALHRFATNENRHFLSFPQLARPLDFFNSLHHQDPHIFEHLRLVCDAGGLLRDFVTHEIISDFFKWVEKGCAQFDGIIIFEESSLQEDETKLLVQLKEWREPKEIKGHDIGPALESMGLNWEKLKLLTFIDPTHRAGANIEQPKGTSLLLLLGEELALSDSAQGVLRGRGVLKKEQKIIWGASQKLIQKIKKKETDQISLERVFEWKAKNESIMIDKEILLSAFQQIEYQISEPVWRQLEQAWHDPEKQIEIWKKYRKGFVKKNEMDPIKRFEDKKGSQNAEQALWAHARECYEAFGYTTPWEKAEGLHKKLKEIIHEVKRRHIGISSSNLFDASRESFMHTEQKEEIKKEVLVSQHSDLKPEDPIILPHWLTIEMEDFFQEFFSYAQPASTVFGSKFLCKNLFFSDNALRTAKTGERLLKEAYMKPVQYVLFVEKNTYLRVYALSDAEACIFKKQVMHLNMPGTRAVLLGWDGSIVQNGRDFCGFTEKELKSPAIVDPLIDVGLSRCELVFGARFLERIQNWLDFWPMWEKMVKGQPIAQEVRCSLVEKLVPSHLKKKSDEEKKGRLSIFNFFNFQ